MARIKFKSLKLPADSQVYTVTLDNTGRELCINTNNGDIFLSTKNLIDTNNMAYLFEPLNKPTNHTEKLFTLPGEKFKAIDFTNMGLVHEPTNVIPRFVVGEKYALKGVSCDGFETKEKVYELVTVVNEYGGVNVNAVVVKQVAGEQGTIFTLSKTDCEHIGIEYQNGLQMFPKELSWTRVVEKKAFDETNLATTPLSEIDNTIRYVLLKLDGFKDYSDGYVVTPSGKLIKEAQFESSIRVTTKEPIVYGNGHMVRDGINLDITLARPTASVFNHGNFISSDDEVFILVKLKVTADNDYETFDHCFGVEPRYFDGIDPAKYFIVMWDEFGAYTIEEYEKEKARKAKEEAERIKREEEKLKRAAEEKAKREEEERLLHAEAVKRMQKHKIKEPVMPSIPLFDEEIGALAGIDFYIDSLDGYFNELDKQLKSIEGGINDFNGMFNNSSRSNYRVAAKDILDFLYKL